jgi:hypothetical protein
MPQFPCPPRAWFGLDGEPVVEALELARERGYFTETLAAVERFGGEMPDRMEDLTLIDLLLSVIPAQSLEGRSARSWGVGRIDGRISRR